MAKLAVDAKEPLITLNYRIMVTGEVRQHQVQPSKIITSGGLLLVEVWPDHFAELELTQPQAGWLVYPD